MVDAIVSSLLEQLISVAFEKGREQVRLVACFRKEASNLKSNLEAIQNVLADAEQRQVKEKAAGRWLEQLKYAAYDMEDVLDEWNTKRMKLEIEGADDDDDDERAVDPHDQKKKKKVCFCFPTSLFGFKFVFVHYDIALKIKEINERLNNIVKEKDMFNSNVSLNKGTPEKLEHETTISSIDVSEIVGRDMEKKFLISKLVSESSAEGNSLHIISLVGMGGIGKTTLAQLAYNDEKIKINFEKRIWVCVSDPFDEFKIVRAIFETLKGSATNLQELQSLTQQIEELIEGKKFFLVLDDVWNEHYNRFEKLYNCLKKGKQGSKILITTRKEIVARAMGSIEIIPIKELNEKGCWSLFERLTLLHRSSEERKILEEIGRKIVGKCKGLPLAVKTIGSLLRSKRTKQEWQDILDSEIWELKELEQGLLAPLLLSYNELPSMVKCCFQYFATFPKGHEINKDELIRLWMAQGYLNEKGNQEMEKIGQSYFGILVTRSFFQEFEKYKVDDNVISCQMHTIVHDFAQYVCKHECFGMKVNNGDESFKDSFGKKVRHLMLQFGNEIPIPTSIFRAKKLRSLLIHYQGVNPSSLNNILSKLFRELTCLRTLHISRNYIWENNSILEVPREIGKLIHLRNLNLSWQSIKKLPKTLCELYNLQSLDISYCSYLEELPQGIGKLINMRYLENKDTHSLKYMPVGIERLTSLRTLKKLVVSGYESVDGSKTCTLESLKDLNLLQECGIEGLGYIRDVGEAERPQLKKKENLLFLYLDFGYRLIEPEELEVGRRKKEEDEQVLEALKPPLSLKLLCVSCYRGKRGFPNWLVSLINLRDLLLYRCSNCEYLPALGKLPSLERLWIMGFENVKRVGNEFLGILESDHHYHGSSSSSSSSVIAFPKLKYLSIWYMYELEEWEYKNITRKGDIIIMPSLSSLKLRICPKLKMLPDQFLQKTTLQHLTLGECPILKSTVDRSKISHIPNVLIY